MEASEKETFEARARIMKALGHASRLMMVDELSRGERCVCELRALVGADLSTVSKHLTVLKNAGIVEDDKRGVQVFYRLKVPCVLNFFTCVEAVLANQAREAARHAG
ncbi:MAG: metalloregulator ArsR/SmtB family transcription factor [Lentisphaeria bacterium]|nr:metalloregulator ArsR/SmtB family transcription factor [Lentisphaeria bacterium]